MTIVTEHLERLGVRFEVLPHERSETAYEEARALGVSTHEVLKPIVLNVESGHAIALIPASARLDLELSRRALGDPSAELASEKDIEGIFPEFEPGALPAVPSLLHIPVVIDRAVLSLRMVTFAAGIQRESVRLETEQLLRGGIVTIAPISRTRQAIDGATLSAATAAGSAGRS